MYRIIIYDHTGVTPLTTLFVPANVYELKYSTELNKAGSATFKIKTLDSKATATNLQLFNRVKIYKGTEGEFSGFIEDLHVDINEIEVSCRGMLALFEKRIKSLVVNGTYYTTSGAAAMALLSQTNSDDDTGITAGTDTTANTIHNVEFTYSPIFSSWQKLADLADTDFEITFDGVFNMKDIGNDLTSSVVFRYIQGQINTATIYEFDVDVSGKDLINFIYARGSSTSLNTTASDATSESQFGLLQDFKSFPQSGHVTDLANEAQTEVDNDKQEFYTPKVRPNIEKIDVDSFDVGDTVSVKLEAGFISVDQNHRIIKKSVTVSDGLTPVVDVSLLPEGTNKLPSSFFDDIIDLQTRVNRIEETA